MNKYLLSAVFFLAIFSCEKYDDKKELLIQKIVFKNARLSNNGELIHLNNIYFNISNGDDDIEIQRAGLKIFVGNNHYIKNLQKIIDKSENDTVIKEASRLLDSIKLNQYYLIKFRNYDFSPYEEK